MLIVNSLTVNDLDALFYRIDCGGYEQKIRRKTLKWVYIRSRLSEAQNHRCCWCKCLTTDERDKRNSSTVEHYKCKTHGGTDRIDNLVMACSRCNNKRGTHHPDDFLAYIEQGRPLPSQKQARKVRTPAEEISRQKRKLMHKLRSDKAVVWC